MNELLRTVRFNLNGKSFTLHMWATNSRDDRGQTVIEYEFGDDENVIFEGADFSGSPLHADDSDDTVRSLVGFLSLRPGDTDAEYFANYTQEQLDFANTYGEELSMYADEEGFELTDSCEE